jgi:HSP20 family protein
MAESKTTPTDQRAGQQEELSRSQTRGSERALGRREPYQSFFGLSPFASPFQLMRRMSEEMDRVFERMFEDAQIERRPEAARAAVWSPRIEVFQKQDKYIVRAELPGIKKDDVQVEVTDDQVTIQGDRREEHEEEREGVFRSERSYGSFYRSVPLPEGVIPESAQASFRDGVLEISVQAPPREVKAQPKRLEIKDASEQGKQK